ncbi:VWA domain-containing protein, partial [uncultured Acinetobacter sp.]
INYFQKFQDQIPNYVLFISDGGVGSSRQMQKILSQAAKLPIFWQFVGIGGRNYGALEKLDEMSGRIVDNCNFFSLDRIDGVSDERLYELLLQEFPDWLIAARQHQIVRN